MSTTTADNQLKQKRRNQVRAPLQQLKPHWKCLRFLKIDQEKAPYSLKLGQHHKTNNAHTKYYY